MPSAHASHRTTIRRSTTDVWEALQDAATWRAIGPIDTVSDAVHGPDGLDSFRWSSTVAGTRHQGTARVERRTAPSAMTLRLVTKELDGELSTSLVPTDDDASTTIEVSLSFTARGLLSNMFFPAIRQAVSSGLPDQVEAFAASIAAP